ncbi:beta-1,4-N-acetylgalactosaminyltransferase 3-like [Dendronephthya gigantea]|uniref:beta-1,4-N-acetylgalactosaminyltransferase 3-like n=1 Tax=Dendronephthya gigantea TaxID=151771 RepID=UPI00106B6C76|nr:beta-1,4-N-acetylgalactosaminyltransferase 3-like [Dendronephthya gigantea]XP_028399947.1 beta-1,4-N-acetylgalactosaminyltransferase 3-like [Dendronephthya gigantea]
MVFTPRRRRLFRAIFAAFVFTGFVLILKQWNLDLYDNFDESTFLPDIAKHSRNSLDDGYTERSRREDINISKVLVINGKTQTPVLNLNVVKQSNITWIQHPWVPSLRGFLNVHVWLDWCGSTINDLRRNIHFPKYPDVRLKTNLFYLSHDAHNFGQRVFGFLHPPKTGHYRFGISSDDSSELWLSSDDDPRNSRLIAWVGNLSDPFWQEIVGDGEFTKYESQISAEIFLRRNRRYFVEALHKQSTSSDHLLVAWKIPHFMNFSYITRGRVSQYIHPHELHNLDVTRYARHIPITPAVLQKPLTLEKLRKHILRGSSNVHENSETQVDPIGKIGRFESSRKKDIHGTDIFETDKNTSHFRTKQANKSIHIYKEHVRNDISLNVSDLTQSFANVMYPSCDYKPSYQVDFKVARYEGVYLIHETSVYPDDMTHLKHVEYFKPCFEMRQMDSHGVLLPGVEELNQNNENDDDLTRQTQITGRTAGNIASVNYTDLHRTHFGLESNFSQRKKIYKRKILEYTGENDRIVHKYERIQDERKNTSRYRSQGAVIGYRNNFKNYSDQDLMKTSTKPERISRIKDPVKTADGFSYDRKRKVAKREIKMVGNKSVKNMTRNDVHSSEDRVMKFVKDAVKTGKSFVLENKNFEAKNINKIKSVNTKTVIPVNSESKTVNKSAGNEDTLNPSESWETLKKRLQKRKVMREADKNADSVKRNALGQEDINNKVLKKTGVYLKKTVQNKKRHYNSSISNKKPKFWHRKHQKTRATNNVFVEDSSPFFPTFKRLKETGQWSEIQKYAQRKGLLLTKKTWMYVTWKFLRYEKPKKPHDKLTEFIYKQNPTKCRTDGNILLNQQVAESVINKYMKDLRNKFGSELFLKRIINVEENHDVIQGDRYLIELELGLNAKGKTIRVSDYVYLPLGANSFCSPREFVWRRNVTVHVIVPVKNQGKWVQHLIDDMTELYERTHDANINLIIVDFNSSDINIKQALKQSSLKRYRFLQVQGSFQRALGIQIGADAVMNSDDIIFTCDLHLDFPNNIIEIIRKHCIQGRMAFSPVVLRLECGFTPFLPYGEWETMGYGLFAMYKSDFDRIGGMNINEFKTKWGGEDWEMVDRCLQNGIEIERFRVPHFFHYFHSKQGMWGSYGFEDNVSGSRGDSIAEDGLVQVYDLNRDNVLKYRYNQPLMPEY